MHRKRSFIISFVRGERKRYPLFYIYIFFLASAISGKVTVRLGQVGFGGFIKSVSSCIPPVLFPFPFFLYFHVIPVLEVPSPQRSSRGKRFKVQDRKKN
ncbi:hypothetical protein F5X96DRAFT_464646 [Biscogniauxia mediterranea]|nr:hypothetical protein F5X96DRAFT_464646 [Biscogniauxia mediterranea]